MCTAVNRVQLCWQFQAVNYLISSQAWEMPAVEPHHPCVCWETHHKVTEQDYGQDGKASVCIVLSDHQSTFCWNVDEKRVVQLLGRHPLSGLIFPVVTDFEIPRPCECWGEKAGSILCILWSCMCHSTYPCLSSWSAHDTNCPNGKIKHTNSLIWLT